MDVSFTKVYSIATLALTSIEYFSILWLVGISSAVASLSLYSVIRQLVNQLDFSLGPHHDCMLAVRYDVTYHYTNLETIPSHSTALYSLSNAVCRLGLAHDF